MQRKRQKIFLLLRVFSLLFREPTQVRKGSKEKNIATTDHRDQCVVVVNVDDEHFSQLCSSRSTLVLHSSSLTFAVNAIFLDIILIYEWRNLDGFFLVFTLCSILVELHSSGWFNVNVMLFRSMMWEVCFLFKKMHSHIKIILIG